jgi:thiosulfate/3-mercaptopyruvate sulfurtransferase
MSNWITRVGLSALIASSSVFAGGVFSSDGYTASMNKYLISAEDAMKLIGKKDVKFVSGDSHDTYEVQGHIKGSVEMYAHHLHHADLTGKMECAPLFMCVDDAQKYIGSKGIDNDTMVIAYDNFRGPNATGVWAYFKSFGHDNVKILNGGMDAIKALDPNQQKYDALKAERKKVRRAAKKAKKAGDIELSKKLTAEAKALKKEMNSLTPKLLVQKGKEHHIAPKTYIVNPAKIDWDLIASKADVKKAVDDLLEKGSDSKYRIIDTRGMTEIIGERKLDNVARGGHVPMSTLLEWKHITDFDRKLSFRKLDELQKVFDEFNVKKDNIIYAYCHVGAGRSTEIAVALKMLGYENVKVYTGSWDEWGNSMELPIRR